MLRMTGPRFSWHMLREVRLYARSGKTSNADVAEVLRYHYDDRISAAHIVRWRKEHPKFDALIRSAAAEDNMIIANAAFDQAADGEPAMVRYWLDRKDPSFMPKSKQELSADTSTLDALLARRAMSDDEARDKGLITDDGE